MLKKALLAMLLWTVTTQGAELEIGLNMTVKGAADAPAADVSSPRHATILVIDKSGSMIRSDTRRDGQSPRDILLTSINLRLETLRAGELVYLLPFSSKIEDDNTYCKQPVTIQGKKEKDSLFDAVKSLKFDGVTLLYDAQAVALRKAQELIKTSPGVRVSVFVYTDGLHQTDGQKSEFPAFAGTDRKPNPNWKMERARAYAAFKEKFRSLFDASGLEMEYEWLSDSEPPDASGWRTKPVIKIGSEPSTLNLNNPISAVKQEVSLTFDFKMPERCWAELEGKSAELIFEAEGRRTSAVLDLMKGGSRVILKLPELPADREVKGRLSLSLLPEAKTFKLSPPPPVVVVFAKPGTVALSSVLPAKGSVVKLGDAVGFSAEATDGAKVAWRFGDGSGEEGSRFEKTFLKSGSQSFTVTATKAGLLSAAVSGSFEVVDAGVMITPPEGKVTVGAPVIFRAIARGPVTGFEWVVDRLTVAGSNTFSWTFEKSGSHTVQARAFYKGILPEVSQVLPVIVGPSPFVAVREPEAGAEFDSEGVIHLRADVEGGFTKVVWKVEGPNSKALESPVADGASTANLRVAKGGEYKVTAVADGEAGTKAGEPVAFSVKSPDFKLVITEPLANQTLENGREVRLVAAVKGRGIEKVKWFARNADAGKRFELGMAPVADGKSGLIYTFPLETGDVRLEISAEVVFAAADPNAATRVDADPVLVNAVTKGGIEVAREEDLDGSTKAFAEDLKLMCKVSGAIKPTDVEWFFIGSEGKDAALTDGKGKDVFTHGFAADGKEKALVDIFARGRMPDGSFKQTKKMRLILVAAERLEIVEPVNGARVSFGKNVPLKETHVGDVRDVKWYANGVEVKEGGYCVNHAGVPETNVAVWAEGVAPGGRKVTAEKRSITAECPKLEPWIKLPETGGVTQVEFRLNEKVLFEVMVKNGKSGRVDWNFGDGTVTANASAGAAHAYTNYGACTVTAKVYCERCGCVESVQQKLSVVKTAPVARFVILPDKETFTVGGKITVVDASEGDVAFRIWTTNENDVVGASGGKLEFTLPKRPGELTFGLRVKSQDGVTSPVYKRSVRVRFGWWAVMPILLAGAVVWWLLFRLLTGNGPSRWTVYSWDGAVPKLMKGGYPEERKYTGKGVPLPIKGYWNWFSKKARIPLSKLLGYSDDGDAPSGGWGLVSAEERFVFRAEGGKPHIEPPNIVIDESGIVADRDIDHYFLFRDAGDTIDANNQFIRVVVEEAPSGWFCPALLILSTFTIIGTVFWLCLEYAV